MPPCSIGVSTTVSFFIDSLLVDLRLEAASGRGPDWTRMLDTWLA